MISFSALLEEKEDQSFFYHPEIPNPSSLDDPTFHEKLSRKLSKGRKIPKEDIFYLKSYTADYHKPESDKDHLQNEYASSRHLNKDLLEHGEPKRLIDQRIHKAILDNVATADKPFHLYSGTSKDFSKIAKRSKDGILHSSAHISASSCPQVALRFCSGINSDERGEIDYRKHAHVLHVEMSKDSKHLHVRPYSSIANEHETIIPSGSRLKYSHTTTHREQYYQEDDDRSKAVIKVHHFTTVS